MQGDAGALAFDAGSYDAVTIGFGIPHVPDPERVFREAKRVLQHRGRFAFSVWRRPEGATGFGIVFSAILKHGDPSVVLPPRPDAHAYADRETAFAALGAAGFIDPAIETVDSYWTVDDPGAPFDYFREGTVRGALLLRRQPPRFSDAIRAAVAEAVRDAYGPRGPWRIPVPAFVISATA